MNELEERFRSALQGSALSALESPAVDTFLDRRGSDASIGRLSDAVISGMARLLLGHADTALYLSNRPGWLEALVDLDAEHFAARLEQLASDDTFLEGLDLEDALDALRLRRRDEMALAACADFGGIVPFAAISEYLSWLAESTAGHALDLAQRNVRGAQPEDPFTVIGMGKIAGREFTYHSDLDLIFLFAGDPAEIERASRVAQRLIAYLTTMTGAGIAYAVDTRLRPSGQQGMLVASFDGYERYQTQQAATWEHLAMLRARPIAGAVEDAAKLLQRIRTRVLPQTDSPWPELSELRQRVIEERAVDDDGVRAIKTGAGGLMDVDFLAGAGLLERGCAEFPPLPSVDAMLRACSDGDGARALLDDYHALRGIEARVRWGAGRGIEQLPESLEVIAELVEPGLGAKALRERIAALRGRIREAYARVVAAGSITAL